LAALIDFGLLFDIGLIVILATVLGFFAKFLKQPTLIAYIITGLIIGPIGLGALNIDIAGFSVGITELDEILILSTLGIAFLLFSVGVETDFSKLANLGKVVMIGGVLQVLLTMLVVFAGTFWFNLFDFTQSVYLGLILSFSSTLIVIKLLSDYNQISTLHGRLLIGYLLVQDAIVIIALPFLANLDQIFSLSVFAPVLAVGLFFLVFAYALNRYVYPSIFRYSADSDELLFLTSVTSCFLFIMLAFLLNFSIALGAFIAGLALSNLPYNLEVLNKIKGLRDFFATIFFVSLGMQIDFSFVHFPIQILLFILLIIYFLKPLLYFFINLFSGYGTRISVIVALSLAQISEFSFIIADLGRDILNRTPGLFSLVIIVIAFSMATTPYLMTNSNSLYDFFKKHSGSIGKKLRNNKGFNRKIIELENIPKRIKDHIVIVGGGVVGFNIAESLYKDHPLVLIDHNSDVVFSFNSRRH